MHESYVFRIELKESTPVIWRTFEVPGAFTLEELHLAIQSMLGWFNYHLYRFAQGELFSDVSLQYLGDFELQEGEQGVPLASVRINEVCTEVGSVLQYAYDYGDNWEFTLRLIEIKEATNSQGLVRCLDGERAAPPEDSGGRRDAESLTEVLPDPAHFDLEEINQQINSWLRTPEGFAPLHLLSPAERRKSILLMRFPFFNSLVHKCRYAPEAQEEILTRISKLKDRKANGKYIEANFSAVTRFLSLVDPKIKLTAAGYVPPKVALQMKDELGNFPSWMGEMKNESSIPGLIEWRETLTKLGLFRKSKGELFVTNKGAEMLRAPERLPAYIASKLLPIKTAAPQVAVQTFEQQAAALVLLFSATSDGKPNLADIAKILSAGGWRSGNDLIDLYDIWHAVWQLNIFRFIGPIDKRSWEMVEVSADSSNLALDSILQMKPAQPRY